MLSGAIPSTWALALALARNASTSLCLPSVTSLFHCLLQIVFRLLSKYNKLKIETRGCTRYIDGITHAGHSTSLRFATLTLTITLTFDLSTPKLIPSVGYRKVIPCISSLNTLSSFALSCGQADRQTERQADADERLTYSAPTFVFTLREHNPCNGLPHLFVCTLREHNPLIGGSHICLFAH